MSPVKPLIFLHIPKTAGTTVQHILNNIYRGKGSFTSLNYRHIEKFLKLSDAEKLKISVLKGHFPFGIHEFYPAPVTYFTFLRHPISRTISEFNHIYRDKNHQLHDEMLKENYSLNETLKKGISKNLDNCQVRFLAAANEVEYGGITEEIYQKALKTFNENFAAFGICERFDESLLFLKEKLHWPYPYYLHTNVTPENERVARVDKETIDLIAEHNRYDMQLYNHAYAVFEANIKALGAEFQLELAKFRKKNKLQSPLRMLARKIYRLFQ